MTDWKVIKYFYTEKKRNWAQEKTNFMLDSKWGDYYGYDLKPPFTLEEVESWNTIIPDDLKTYLTQVSREIFCAKIPFLFSPTDTKGEYIYIGYEGDNVFNVINASCGRVFRFNNKTKTPLAGSFKEYLKLYELGF